ncbi:MAG: HAD hydrolase family protein [Candidatus Rokubacteria bacterium]|nr:HAD hydrolase family protein [Candidatus Rokubacteria bacterium]
MDTRPGRSHAVTGLDARASFRVPSAAMLARRFREVRLLIVDVDGVLTDAGMYYSEGGDELKKFNTRDGHGIKLLEAEGIPTAIVTRERTEIVSRRARKLGIKDLYQGVFDKLPVVRSLADQHEIDARQACYIGDDLGDLEAMGFVGLPVAVRDAVPEIKRTARYVTRRRGGEGAVREVCDLILAARTGSLGLRAFPGTLSAFFHRRVRSSLRRVW